MPNNSEFRDRWFAQAVGFVGMFGGVLLTLLLAYLAAVEPSLGTGYGEMATGEGISYGAWAVGHTVLLLPGVFLGVAAVGLVVYQRPELSAVGVLGGGLLVVTGMYTLAIGVVNFAFGTTTTTLFAVADLGFLGGSFGLGVATARANELRHARLGGWLLACALPVGGAVAAGLLSVGVRSSLVLVLTAALPYGAGWVVLGYDLLVARVPGVGDRPVGQAGDTTGDRA